MISSSDGGDPVNGTFLSNNMDVSGDGESLYNQGNSGHQVQHIRQNRKISNQRRHENGHLNERYSQAAYKSQPRSGAHRDNLSGSSSI